MNNTLGYWLIAGICCIEPIICILIGAAIQRQLQRRRHGIYPNHGRDL